MGTNLRLICWHESKNYPLGDRLQAAMLKMHNSDGGGYPLPLTFAETTIDFGRYDRGFDEGLRAVEKVIRNWDDNIVTPDLITSIAEAYAEHAPVLVGRTTCYPEGMTPTQLCWRLVAVLDCRVRIEKL